MIFDVRDRQLPQEELLSHRTGARLAETEHFIILIMNASYRWLHVERSRSASGTWSTSGGALRKLLANPSH